MLKAVSKRIRSLRPVQILTLGFLSVVIPFATVKEGTDITFMDALFTATSAVCVTGLTVVNTGLVFTLFGKLVILSLIQIGGLGFMTIASILFMVVGKRISLKERLLIQESFNTDSLQGMVRLVRNAVAVTFAVEGIAALILCARLIPEYGVGKGIFHAVFLSISGFCNAGFDAFGFENSIEHYMTDPVINLVIMALITLGGMGFAVIMDVLRNRRFSKLMLHSRVVLLMSLGLFLTGFTADKIYDAVIKSPLYDPESLPIRKIEDFREAVLVAAASATEGDIVLLSPACASFDHFRNFVERGETFRSIVNELK